MQKNELKAYIKENLHLIYEYINNEILKDIGVISFDFFVKLTKEYFNKNEKRVCTNGLSVDTFIYYLLAEVLGESKQAYPYFRKDTLLLDKLFQEAKVYFNYVKFTIEDNTFNIYLVQTKAGVSALDDEIIKFSKQLPIKSSGIKDFIRKTTK